jgi:hypothetical protein
MILYRSDELKKMLEASLNIPIFEKRKVPVTCYNCNEKFFPEGYNPSIESILAAPH